MSRFCPQCGTQVEQRPFEGKPRPTCPSCGFVVFVDPKVAASVLIARDERLLLVRRAIDPARGLWCFPGGYVDFGEDPAAAAARECLEETGLLVENLGLLDVAFNGTVIVISYTGAVAADAQPVPGDDAAEVGWFVPADLPPLAFWTIEQAIRAWRAKQTINDER